MPLLVMAQQYPVTSINISLPQNPDAKIANWGIGTSIISINVSTRALGGKLDPILEGSRILVQIKKGSSKVCGAYTLNSAPAANFTSINKIWNGANAVSLLGQECTLTPGEYEICVRIYGGPESRPMSEEKCKSFTIKSEETAYNKPQNILPAANAIFNVSMATQPVNLKWISVSPKPSGNVTYQLKIWKIYDGQTASQAITQNQPIATKDVLNVNQTIITNLIDPSCISSTTGCQYVWQVQAFGTGTTTYGPNNGKSDFTVFNVLKQATTANTESCASTSTKSFVSGDEIKLSDDFIMKLTSNPTGTNDSLTGVGTVRVKWLGNFNVRFKGIKIDGNNKLCNGAVFTNKEAIQEYPVQFLVNATNANNNGGEWTVSKLKEVANFIKANKQIKPIVPAFLTPQVDSSFAILPINMPVGYFKDGDTANCIGFTEMIFRKDYAEFEAIANLNTQKFFKDPSNAMNGTESISLRGVGIKFSNTGLTGVVGSIKLVEPIIVTYANNGTEDLKLKFNKEASGHIGNGIVFDGLGTNFWKYNLDVDMNLPKEWLVLADGSNNNVSLNFQLNTSKWSDYVAEANLPACIIPNAKGLGIQAGVIAYDHSFIANPTDMVFPTGYADVGNTNTFFTGFYLKNFKLTLPDELRSYADTSKKIEVIAQNLIIDEFGLSGKILANNVLNFPFANIGNLGASIDTVSVSLVNNSLTEAKMLGKIVLPLSSTNDVQDAINYSALFASNNPSFIFTLKPNNDIKSKFLGDGKLQINQTSTLNLTLSKINNKRAVSFNIDINGSLYYPSGKIIDPNSNIPLDLDLSCKFQHLGMTYTTGNSDNFSFNPGQWKFASSQKKLSGFAFTITDVKPKIDPITTVSEKQYLFKGGVELVAKINIGSENSNINISGDTKLILRGAIISSKYTPPSTPDTIGIQTLIAQINPNIPKDFSLTETNEFEAQAMIKDQYGFLTQLKPKYLGVEVKSIHIDVTTPAVKIKGDVEFFKKDIKYGNGFKGNLQAKFTTPSLSIQAGAIFGNTKYIPNNTGNGFKYWMVEAQVGLPPPGIAFLGALAIRGFGAGVYSRMEMTPPTTFNPTNQASSTFGGAVFTPDATIKLGFKAKVIIATTPKEETFNGSATLGAQFNSSGINFINFEGLFYCGAKIGEENNAFANGQLLIDYNFPTKVLDMNVSININKDPISTPTPAKIRLYIDGKNNKWYFKAGVPTSPMAVKIIDTDVEAYLMFGNDLGTDVPTGFMPKTVQRFSNLNYSLPTFSQNATSDNRIKSGKGFALGIGVHMDKNDTRRFSVNEKNYLDVTYKIIAGGELNASLLQYENCEGLGKGWRVRVGLAGYASADCDYAYKTQIPGWRSGSGSIFKVKAAISGIAEFPKPTYIQGSIEGSVEIAGIKRSLNKSFTIGDQCSGTEQTTNEPAASTQQNASDELNYSLIKNIVTPGTDNVNRKTSIIVDLNYPFNKSFDVDEQQATGEIKVRKFRANYTITLTQDSLSAGAEMVTLNSTIISSNSNNTKSNSSSTSTSNTTSNNITLYPKGVDMYGAQIFALNSMPPGNNALKANTSYKFKIVGKLEENINGSWQVVKKKNSTQTITETQQLYFKTNSENTLSVTGTNNQINNSATQKIKNL